MAVPLAIPIAAMAVSAAGTGAQIASTGKMNKKTREFTREQNQLAYERSIEQFNRENAYNEGMWEKQKAYNESVWAKQNAYDSPAAQMQRFKDAGLNPALAYGQMSGGAGMEIAGANMADSPGVPAQAQWNPKVPEMDFSGAIMAAMQMKQMELQNNNLEADQINKEKEGAIKDLQAIGLGIGNMKALFDYDFESELRQTSLDYRKNRVKEQNSRMDNALYKLNMDFQRMGLEQTRVEQFVRESQQKIQESIARTGSINAGVGLTYEKIKSETAGRGLTHLKGLSEEQKLQIGEIQKLLASEKLTQAQRDVYLKAIQLIISGAGKK